MASDVEIVVRTLPRLDLALRSRASPVGVRGAAVSEHQVRILRQLDVSDPAMVTELSESMCVTPSTMSLNLKRLEEAGLVIRTRDPDDLRVTNVRLTPEGARARDEFGGLDVARVDAVLRALDPEERRIAVRGLLALAEAADAVTLGVEHLPASARRQ